MSPSSSLHISEARPSQQRQGCFSNFVESPVGLRISTISVNRPHSRQSIDRAYIFDFSNDMASTVLISTTKKSSFSTKDARSIGWSKSRKFLFDRKRKLLAWTVSLKSYLQKEYQKNLSLISQVAKDKTQTLITNRLSVSGMAGVIGDWLIALTSRSILTGWSRLGYEYNATTGIRTAISAYHNPILGTPLGQEERISALISYLLFLIKDLHSPNFILQGALIKF